MWLIVLEVDTEVFYTYDNELALKYAADCPDNGVLAVINCEERKEYWSHGSSSLLELS